MGDALGTGGRVLRSTPYRTTCTCSTVLYRVVFLRRQGLVNCAHCSEREREPEPEPVPEGDERGGSGMSDAEWLGYYINSL